MIKAKKSLGQNFLINNDVIQKIVNLIEIKDKNILEIGPGTGNLSIEILKKKPKKFLMIEKDQKLSELLKKKFNISHQIINSDVLKIDENKLCNQTLTVFGNLPYNISTEILIKWILNIKNERVWFDYLVLMFQKEVADRIIADFNSKNYGRLTILTNWRLNIKKICDIQPACFYPKPKVQSTLLLFEPKKKFFIFKNPKNLEIISRVFFMHRRKMVKKPFKQLFNENFDLAKKIKIDLNSRPQNLDLKTYFELTLEYENLRS